MTVWRRVKVARIRAAAVDPHHRVASISDQAVEDELLQCGDHGTLEIGQCRQQLVVDELRRDGAAPNLLHGVDRATTHARAASRFYWNLKNVTEMLYGIPVRVLSVASWFHWSGM